MYVKLTNGKINRFPYTIENLRRDNKTVSFPKNISDSVLADYGVYRVKESDIPNVDSKTHRHMQDIKLVDGEWTVVWEVIELDLQQAENNVKGYRDNLLKSSDWTQLDDSVVNKQDWAAYRQALRDITDQEEFPYNVIWPIAP
jgi:hypothetical protein